MNVMNVITAARDHVNTTGRNIGGRSISSDMTAINVLL